MLRCKAGPDFQCLMLHKSCQDLVFREREGRQHTKVEDMLGRSESSILYFSISGSERLRLCLQKQGQLLKWGRQGQVL
jgi:hypothetical protein